VTEKLRQISQMSQRRHRKMRQTAQSSHKLGLWQRCPHGNYHPRWPEASRTAVCGPNVQGNSASVTQRQLISSHHKNVATNTSMSHVVTHKHVKRPSAAADRTQCSE